MKKIIFTILMMMMCVSNAQARNYVWTDDEFRFKILYPDSWRQVTGLSDFERIRVVPDGQGRPVCAITAKEDRRFVIYPKRYYKDILFKEVQWDHWDKITAQLEDRFFYAFKEGGVSHGDARSTVVDYTINSEGKKTEYRRSLIYTGIYHDVNFIAMCDVQEKYWPTYIQSFNEFIGSIHFEPRYQPLFNGYYRDFLEESDESARKDERTWFERQLDRFGITERKSIEFERQHRDEY